METLNEQEIIENMPEHSYNNYDAVKDSGHCSCYFCFNIFPIREYNTLTNFLYTGKGIDKEIVLVKNNPKTNEKTILCPHCDMDTVIPGVIPRNILIKGFLRWFTGRSNLDIK